MKRTLLCILMLALIACALPAGAMAAAKVPVGLMYEGDTVTLGPKLKGVPVNLLDWKSTDTGVATVSGGRIDGVATGKTVVSASYRGKTALCGVVVLPRELTVGVGEIVSLPCGGREKYYVEHKVIAAVNRQGEILGKSAGTTRIGIACGKQRMIVQLTVTEGAVAMTPQPPQSAAAGLDCAAETDQIVLVEYLGGSKAKLSIHEKRDGVWKELTSGPAYVGRNGIGKTQEGDGKTPTGTFNLTQPFGIKANPGANMPYTQVTKYHYWCGSSDSEYYNQLVDAAQTGRACTGSDEHLIDYKGVYNYCMFIDYNASGEAGKGSCIFLHCKGSKDSTAGCIAVSESVMKNIIKWARPGCKIVIK